jgi:hypothetical protein
MEWYPSDPTTHCVRTNEAGVAYEEFSCLYSIPTARWEAYDVVRVRDWMVANPWLPVLACVLYGVLIVVGRSYFSTRPAWNQRRFLAMWNLGLSLFSFMGFLRVAPALFHLWTKYSWKENFCFDPEAHYGSGTVGVWVQLFILSKFP